MTQINKKMLTNIKTESVNLQSCEEPPRSSHLCKWRLSLKFVTAEKNYIVKRDF